MNQPHTQTHANPAAKPVAGYKWLLLLVCAAPFINALMFSSYAASPLIEADAWYFLESFIARYLDGTLKPLDFFIQRGSGDHAQPLQKLILLWHTRYFGMDFRIEGIIGVLLGGVFCWLMVRKLRPSANDSSSRILQLVLAGLVFSIALSLNATNIFAWSLVTLTYLIYLLGIINFFIAYHHAKQPSPAWLVTLFFSSLATGVLMDETGIIFLVAAMLGILVSPPNGIRRALPTLAAILSATFLSRLLMWWINQKLGISASAFSSEHSITSTLLHPDAYKAVVIPLQDSLIHAEHLGKIEHGKLLAWSVLAFTFGLQIFFWATALKAFLRKERDIRFALGAFLCLIAYAITFGIVVNRVPEFGWNYLHQPRYVLFYQMTLIAPLLALHYLLEKPHRPAWLKPATATVSAVMICVQVFLSIQAWEMPKYYREYRQNAAYIMEDIQTNPEHVPANCPVHTVSVCEKPLEKRQQLLNLLKDNRMNIYSNSFQRRNSIYPTRNAASTASYPQLAIIQTLTSENGMLSATPGSINLCEAKDEIISSHIAWDASSVTTEGVEVWLQGKGEKEPKLWAADGPVASSTTGKWLRNEHSIILIDGVNKSELARITLKAIPCSN